jgi:hypothetical protein
MMPAAHGNQSPEEGPLDNGYSNHATPLLKNTGFKHKKMLAGTVMHQAVLNKIRSLLAKYNIKTIHIPVKKYIHMLTPIKDKLDLKAGCIYCIPCKCSKVYTGQMGRNKLDARNIRHACQPEMSAVAEHRFEMAHDQLSSTFTLAKGTGYVNY